MSLNAASHLEILTKLFCHFSSVGSRFVEMSTTIKTAIVLDYLLEGLLQYDLYDSTTNGLQTAQIPHGRGFEDH